MPTAGRPEYHNSLGNVYRTLGRPADAIEEFREALSLKPNFSIAYNNLGIALADCGQNRGAVACFRAGSATRPAELQAWMNLGSRLCRSGKNSERRDLF